MDSVHDNIKEAPTVGLPARARNPNSSSVSLLLNAPNSPPSGSLEIRLFYVRISPCTVDSVPAQLNLCHLRREIGAALEINGSRLPASDTTSIILRRDRLDRGSSEVTYVSTETVRVTGAVEFVVYEGRELILCGSFERIDSSWCNGVDGHQLVNDPKTGWCMNCCSAASMVNGGSSFYQPKLGVSSPSIEVYVAGCCSGSPLILSKNIDLSPRKKLSVPRLGMLDSIPEDEEGTLLPNSRSDGLLCHQTLPGTEWENNGYNSEGKDVTHEFYSPEGRYYEEDGQLSWFNAGVRVGVGIGLGMCLGIGIGVGLLLRSYQATTRTFRRRFL